MPGIVSLVKDSGIYGLTGVASRLIGIAFTPIYTRLLVPADYGVMDTLSVGTSLLGMLMELGCGSGIARYYYETSADRRRILAFISLLPFLVSLPVSLLLSFSSVSISTWLYQTPVYATSLAIRFIDLPLGMLWSNSLLLTRLRMETRTYSLLAVLHLLTLVGGNVLFVVYLRMGVSGIFLSSLIANALWSMLSWFRLRHAIYPSISLPLVRSVFAYGLPIVPASLLRWAQRYLDRFLLLAMVGLAQVGIYGFAFRVGSLITLFTGPLELAWTPFALSTLAKPGHKQMFARILTYYAGFACLAISFLNLFAEGAVRLLAASSYWSATPLVGPLTAVVALDTGFVLVGIGVNAAKKTYLNLIAFALGTITDVAGVLFLTGIMRIGVLGAAVAWMIASLLSTATVLAISQRVYPIPYDLPRVARALALAALVWAVAQFLNGIEYQIIRLVLSATLWLGCLVAVYLWVFPRDINKQVISYISNFLRRG